MYTAEYLIESLVGHIQRSIISKAIKPSFVSTSESRVIKETKKCRISITNGGEDSFYEIEYLCRFFQKYSLKYTIDEETPVERGVFTEYNKKRVKIGCELFIFKDAKEKDRINTCVVNGKKKVFVRAVVEKTIDYDLFMRKDYEYKALYSLGAEAAGALYEAYHNAHYADFDFFKEVKRGMPASSCGLSIAALAGRYVASGDLSICPPVSIPLSTLVERKAELLQKAIEAENRGFKVEPQPVSDSKQESKPNSVLNCLKDFFVRS